MNGINRGMARCGAVLVVGMLGTVSGTAHAGQTSGADQTKPSSSSTADTKKAMKYDPIMAKRADLRTQYDKSAHAGTISPGALKIDHSRLIDFMNILPKRSDLRMRVAKVGLEQAYAEWSHQNTK